MYGCVPCVCPVPAEVRGGLWISWIWSYKQFWAITQLQRNKHGSSRTAASALNRWVIFFSPVWDIHFFDFFSNVSLPIELVIHVASFLECLLIFCWSPEFIYSTHLHIWTLWSFSLLCFFQYVTHFNIFEFGSWGIMIFCRCHALFSFFFHMDSFIFYSYGYMDISSTFIWGS